MAIQNNLSFLNTGLKVVSSAHATEDDGYEEKEIMVKRGGFWERVFDTDPTLHIWDDYKPVIVKVPKRKPAIYRLYDMIIAHPSLLDAITKGFVSTSTALEDATTHMIKLYKYMEYTR